MYPYPQQLEIEFFWPLTEQIPLDLDYEGCVKPQITHINLNGDFTGATYYNIVPVNVGPGNLTIDAKSVKIKVDEKPNIIRRGLYSLLGLQWEKR